MTDYVKHDDGYSNHIRVECPECHIVLLECKGRTGQEECTDPRPKLVTHRRCNDCDPSYLRNAQVITV